MHDLARKMQVRGVGRDAAHVARTVASRATRVIARATTAVSHIVATRAIATFSKECVDERRQCSSAYKGEHAETGHHQDDRQEPPLLVLAEEGDEIADERGLGLVRRPLECGSFVTRVGLLHLWHPQNWRK